MFEVRLRKRCNFSDIVYRNCKLTLSPKPLIVFNTHNHRVNTIAVTIMRVLKIRCGYKIHPATAWRNREQTGICSANNAVFNAPTIWIRTVEILNQSRILNDRKICPVSREIRPDP